MIAQVYVIRMKAYPEKGANAVKQYFAEDQRPSLLKSRWNPKSFSGEVVEPEKLHTLIEAARGTPSYKNEQPWNFIIVASDDSESYRNLLECLAETSIARAKRAPVLMLSVARLNFEADGSRNKHAFRDLAEAVSNMTLRAESLGLQVRQIAGFDAVKARRRFQIPEGHDPVAVIALGYSVDAPSTLKDEVQSEVPTGLLRSIESMAFAGRWGQPAALPIPQPCP